MRKLYFLLLLLILFFSIFVVVVLTPKNYQLKYKINDISIVEEYKKKENAYLFLLTYEDVEYPLYLTKNYTKERKLIKRARTLKDDDTICLNLVVDSRIVYICSKDKDLVDISTLKDEIRTKFNYNVVESKVKETYKNIKVYDKTNDYLIWNYKGFYKIGSANKEIKILKKDKYENNISIKHNDYLILADYDGGFVFNKLYVYNNKNGSVKTITSDFELSTDSYFLGSVNNSVYLLDTKNKLEYEINIDKQSVKIISNNGTAKMYINNNWEEESIIRVINNKLKFTTNVPYKYEIIDNKLYIIINDSPILVSNQKVDDIIYQDNKTVYYLSKDKLYKYEYLKGEKLLLQYSEWNFNYKNNITIFN